MAPRSEMTPKELMESWNEICGSEGLPMVKYFTPGREAKARRRLKTFPDVEFWGQVFNGIIQSEFLMGRNQREGNNWKATFDWIISNDENPAKVAEGRYD